MNNKDYNQDPAIQNQWTQAKKRLADALTVTIFGYGAPESDVEAVSLMHTAWLKRSTRMFEHVEVIDTADLDVLRKRWSPFTPTDHMELTRTFDMSHIARWPRRVSESWAIPMTEGRVCEDFPLPSSDDLDILQKYCNDLAQFE